MRARTVAPVSPTEMPDEEFFKPLGLTKYRLAKAIGVPPQRIGDIVAGERSITADTDQRLCSYFGMSDGWRLRGTRWAMCCRALRLANCSQPDDIAL